MSGFSDDVAAICHEIQAKYSACDVSDALLKLKVPAAGFLPDILPATDSTSKQTFVAPVSTVLFVPKSHEAGSSYPNRNVPSESNLPEGSHWTDCPTPGSIVLIQQPDNQVCAILGDILATRLKVRGTRGVIADGRIRDIAAISELCDDGAFTVWSKGTSTVGTGLEAKAWACDVPLFVGRSEVRAGDVLIADQSERGIVVIPQAKLQEVMSLLPSLKEADDKVVADVQNGVAVTEAFRRHRG
ncbi:hypothetical protein MBLNU230_g7256t1 [Neophaeotheca triangularis]